MRAAVITFPGSNCDYDLYKAVQQVGGEAEFRWHRDPDVGDVDAVLLPGGFSYGDYLRAGAEDLPLPEAALEGAVFFNSLHHVPVPLQDKALAEAARVIRPEGFLYILEPLAEGPSFRAGRLIDDETEVRARAYEAIQAAAEGPLFRAEREMTYLTAVRYDSFAHFRDHVIAVDERRRPRVEAKEAALRQAFEANGELRDGVYHFDQPCRLNLLRRN